MVCVSVFSVLHNFILKSSFIKETRKNISHSANVYLCAHAFKCHCIEAPNHIDVGCCIYGFCTYIIEQAKSTWRLSDLAYDTNHTQQRTKTQYDDRNNNARAHCTHIHPNTCPNTRNLTGLFVDKFIRADIA